MKEEWFTITKEPTTEHVPAYPTNELGRASFSCCISDWNPDWDVFIETSWKLDSNGVEISPTLYRDTELRLKWDYFGFEKNLYKPAGYPDGIYLWNPRTWEPDGDIKFSFYELVRCGTQKVLYPCIDPNVYKLWTYPNRVNYYEFSNSTSYGTNPGIGIDLRTPNYSIFSYIKDIENAVDVHIEMEVPPTGSTRMWGGQELATGGTTIYDLQERKSSWYTVGQIHTTAVTYSYEGDLGFGNFAVTNGGVGYTYATNWSNFRQNLTGVVGISNVYKGQPWTYYTWKNKTKIEDTTNLNSYGLLYTEKPTYNNGGTLYSYDGDIDLTSGYSWGPDNQGPLLKGVIHKAQSYEFFEMAHYWIAVPKGLWYTYNGVEKRIPDNGLFDLMTGEFRDGYKQADGYIGVFGSYNNYAYNKWMADGITLVYLKDQEVNINYPFNYFDSWSYNTTDIDYIVKVSPAAKSYV